MAHDRESEVSEPSLTIVVPMYQPGREHIQALADIATAGLKVIAVDDSPAPQSSLRVHPEVHVLTDGQNHGIAHALNVGIREAFRSEQTSAVLTLDQDTIPNEAMLDAARELARSPAGIIATPATVGGVKPILDRRGMPLEVIQSGMVITRGAWSTVGGFDEGLVIDCVDTDFYLRSRLAGVPHRFFAADLNHAIGHSRRVRVFGRTLSWSSHSIDRQFYIVRNRIIVSRRYAEHFPEWGRRHFRGEMIALCMDLITADDPLGRLRTTCRAIRAALRYASV